MSQPVTQPSSSIEDLVRDLRHVRHCVLCGRPLIAAPKLKCAHCGERIRLRCLSYRRSGQYFAECIDLDLISRGETQEEAIGKLQEAMYGYLKVAFEGDTKGLILRRSPFSHRLRYHLQRLAERIAGHRKHFMPYTADIPYTDDRPRQLSEPHR